MVLRSEFIAKQVLENKVSRAFLHAIPGLEDYSMLGKVWFHTTEEEDGRKPKWDLVILDGPATGHLHHHAADPAGHPRRRARGAAHPPGRRHARRCCAIRRARPMVIVTLAEDLPSNEAIELSRKADRDDRHDRSVRWWSTALSAALRHRRRRRARSTPLPEDVGDAEPAAAGRPRRARRSDGARSTTAISSGCAAICRCRRCTCRTCSRADFGPEAVDDLAARLGAAIGGAHVTRI